MRVRLLYLNVNQGLEAKVGWEGSFLNPRQRPSHACVDLLVRELKRYEEKRVFVASEVTKRCWLTGKNLVEKIRREGEFEHVAYGRSFYAEYVPQWKGKWPPQFDGGTAIFSDFPLDDVVVGAFPPGLPLTRVGCSFVGERTFVMARVRHGEGSFFVVGTHLSALKDFERELAAERLVGMSRCVKGPLVLMLDANAVPCYVPESKRYGQSDGDWMRNDYRRDRTLHVLRGGFEDACPVSAFRDVEPDVSVHATFRGYHRIDYVLTKNLPRPSSYVVRPEPFSDHQMIDCVMDIPAVDAECGGLGRLLVAPKVTIPNRVACVGRTLYRAGQKVKGVVNKLLGE